VVYGKETMDPEKRLAGPRNRSMSLRTIARIITAQTLIDDVAIFLVCEYPDNRIALVAFIISLDINIIED
jgi:hypothetical protein